jgi:hypothetical protein
MVHQYSFTGLDLRFFQEAKIKTSVFGAEFVRMKQGSMECRRGLQYKLRMMGVAISGLSYINGDNMSVIHNTQQTDESVLKKKSNVICYHAIREAVAMGECLTGPLTTILLTFAQRLYREGVSKTI